MKIAIAIALLLVVALIGKCGLHLYQVVDEFPEEAQVHSLRARYPDLIADLDNAIKRSDSASSLITRLKAINYPNDTLSVQLDDGTDDELSIINRFKPRTSGSMNLSRKTVINSGGYGQKNGQHFWILQYALNKYEYDHIEILLERKFAEQPEALLKN